MKHLLVIIITLIIGASQSFAGSSDVTGTDRPLGFIETRSKSPLQQLRYGIRHRIPSLTPPGKMSLELTHNWMNMWLYVPEAYLIDAEIHELSFGVKVGLSDRLELSTNMPFRNVSGGVMDGFIEGFHKTLGISNADRDQFSRNKFVFKMHNGMGENGWSSYDNSGIGWEMGNATVSLSTDLSGLIIPGIDFITTLTVKIPTGTKLEFLGTQGVDLGLSSAMRDNFGPLYWYLSSGVVYYSDNEMIGIRLRQWHYSMLFAFELRRPHSSHSWIFQVLAENGVTREFSQFSEATYEAMIGYKREIRSGVIFEMGLLENMFVFDNSPDVGLHTGIHYNFK